MVTAGPGVSALDVPGGPLGASAMAASLTYYVPAAATSSPAFWRSPFDLQSDRRSFFLLSLLSVVSSNIIDIDANTKPLQ